MQLLDSPVLSRTLRDFPNVHNPIFRVVSESPRWLVQKGRIDDAKKVIERMCKIDRRPFDKETLDYILDKETKVLAHRKITISRL